MDKAEVDKDKREDDENKARREEEQDKERRESIDEEREEGDDKVATTFHTSTQNNMAPTIVGRLLPGLFGPR